MIAPCLILSTTVVVPAVVYVLTMLRVVKVAARKAGLQDIGVHTLRHSAASAMLEAGVPLHTVSEILGHASVQVTGDIYGHVSTEGARAAMDRLAQALSW